MGDGLFEINTQPQQSTLRSSAILHGTPRRQGQSGWSGGQQEEVDASRSGPSRWSGGAGARSWACTCEWSGEVYGRHGEGPRQGYCPNVKEEHEGGQAAAHRWTHEGNGQGESENGTAAADPENSGNCEEKGRRRKGATGKKMEGEDTADATPQTGEAGGEAMQGGPELEEGPGGDAVARGAPDTVFTGAERGAAGGEGAVGVAGAAEACAGPADIMPRKTAGKAGAGAAGIGRRRARGAGGQLAAGACRKSEGGVNETARKTRKVVHPGTGGCHMLPGARRRQRSKSG
ncbi:spidroin-1-like [Drosophila bipectinata]|uniref:spidroin-1-like n=1 Tax=Drosophila bipectinata TaxID=42026 RepID=UPI0038B3980D